MIINSLDPENLQKFRVSCFGRFLEMSEMRFQGQLLVNLFESLDPESLNNRRMSFILNSKEFELGPLEYYVITGLSFKDWYSPPIRSDFHDEVFGRQEKLFFSDVYEKFRKVCTENKGKGELCLKLALLVILYGILLIRHKTTKRIEVQFMHLLDDLSKFNRFPWGLVSYEFLVTVSHNARGRIDSAINIGTQPAIDAHGFTFALQVFAYEVNSVVAANCAVKRSNMLGRVPRMLRWDAVPNVCFHSDICKYLATNASERSIVLTPSEKLELQSEGVDQNYKCIVELEDLLQFVKVTKGKYNRKRKLASDDEREDGHSKRRNKHSDGTKENPVNLSTLPTARQMDTLISTIRDVLRVMKSVERKIDLNACSCCGKHNDASQKSQRQAKDFDVHLAEHVVEDNEFEKDEAEVDVGGEGLPRGKPGLEKAFDVHLAEHVVEDNDHEKDEAEVEVGGEGLPRGKPGLEKASVVEDEVVKPQIVDRMGEAEVHVGSEGSPKGQPKFDKAPVVEAEVIKQQISDGVEVLKIVESAVTSYTGKASASKTPSACKSPKQKSKKRSAKSAKHELNVDASERERVPKKLEYGKTDVEFPLAIPEKKWIDSFEEWYTVNRPKPK